jgi:hypothetical protein
MHEKCMKGVRAMSDIEGRARRIDHSNAGTTGGIATAVLMLGFFASEPARAQITFGVDVGPIEQPQTAVCNQGGTVLISVDDDCDDDGQLFPTSLSIGPSGSRTTFNASDGSASFSGSANFSGQTTFANTTTNGVATIFGLNVPVGGFANMNGNRVQNVGDPTAGTDATNKNYVDGLHNQQQTQINDIVVVNNQQNTRLTNIETVNVQQDTRLTNVETVNTQQDTRLTGVETVNTQQNTRLTSLESGFAGQAEQISAINQSLKRLSRRDGELADGIAISLALAQPAFQPGQKFAIRGGWGNFDGSNALGVSAAGLLYSFRNGGSVILDVGVGASMRYNMFAGRGGVTLGW